MPGISGPPRLPILASCWEASAPASVASSLASSSGVLRCRVRRTSCLPGWLAVLRGPEPDLPRQLSDCMGSLPWRPGSCPMKLPFGSVSSFTTGALRRRVSHCAFCVDVAYSSHQAVLEISGTSKQKTLVVSVRQMCTHIRASICATKAQELHFGHDCGELYLGGGILVSLNGSG